jgi:hypothetical protein
MHHAWRQVWYSSLVAAAEDALHVLLRLVVRLEAAGHAVLVAGATSVLHFTAANMAKTILLQIESY